jgi:opacity protein-like surface antigen
MSRPVLPTLAVLFLGWSSVAIAAESPPDAEEAEARDDVQAKKKKRRKKRRGPVASGAPALPGQDTHPAQQAARRRHAAKRAGAQGEARPAARSGGKKGGPAVRGGQKAQRSQAAGTRNGVGAASAAKRPGAQRMDRPGRGGSAGGPVRGGAEQPGARPLPGKRVKTRPDLRRTPQGRADAPARDRSGGSWHGAGDAGASSSGDAGATRGQRGGVQTSPNRRVDPGERMGAGQAERGARSPGRAARGQAPGAGNRATQAHTKPRIVRVNRSKYVPERWTPEYHRRGLNHLPKYHPKYWGSGVFLYNPPSRPHRVTVVEQGAGTQTIEKNADKPLRAVDRAGTFAIGLRGGSYMGRGADGERHADNGLGVAARFRPVEALGVEVAWSRHQDSWETDAVRTTDPLSVSGQIFAMPWTRVSPYLSAGYTWTHRSAGLQGESQTLKGPHAGLGLELAIGDSAALGVEGRYTHYGQLQNISTNYQRAGALQGTLGMNFYF